MFYNCFTFHVSVTGNANFDIGLTHFSLFGVTQPESAIPIIKMGLPIGMHVLNVKNKICKIIKVTVSLIYNGMSKHE